MMSTVGERPPVLKQVRALIKNGNPSEALRVLAHAIRAGRLGPEDCENAGRMIQKQLTGAEGAPRVRVLLLGQFTTSWLAPVLTAVAWGDGCFADVREGGYDTVLQTLMTLEEGADHFDVVILLPWNQRLIGSSHKADAFDDELGFWRKVWELAIERTRARILQVGYDWVTPGPLGHHLSGAFRGDVGRIRRINEALRGALPHGAFFVDLEQVSGALGRERFYDRRHYFWTKQPFSEVGLQRLAAHLWAGIRALMTGPKKVLVVDLDNTLWGGVVAETGPLGIALGESPDGEAYREFQGHLKGLSDRGVLLAICSKNNPDDALAPFQQNPQMLLSLGDFACVEANWEPKTVGLRRIAETLNLGLDSFVFFDDNPAEQEQVRQVLPEVSVVEVPADPSEYVTALQSGLWFEVAELSAADAQRPAQYQQEKSRRALQETAASMSDYLLSLDMEGCVKPIGEAEIQRVFQLIGKTNQFNLTTRRHSLEDLRRLLCQPDSIHRVLFLRDKFGDHGLTSVLLAVPAIGEFGKALRIDTWLMSCRVIGRTAEQFFFNDLIAAARELGYQWLEGEYVPTRKNALVADLLDRLGFSRYHEGTDGTRLYRLALAQAACGETFVRPSLL